MKTSLSLHIAVSIAVLLVAGFLNISCKADEVDGSNRLLFGAAESGNVNPGNTGVNTAPVINNISPAPDINQGSTYTYTPNVTDPDKGDSKTYTISGTLPSWLTFNPSTGVLSGTPGNSDVGTYGPFTITVTDSKGATGSTGSFSITVNNVNDNPTVSGTPTGGAPGSPYSWTPVSGDIDGDTLTFSISSGSLPPGLSINSSTGEITGTPTTAGTYTFTILVSDGKGGTALHTITITISANNNPPVFSTGDPTGATEDSPYSWTPPVTDPNDDILTYSISAGSLPPGLGINAGTGTISGTPTVPGTYTFTIQVSDGKGGVTTKQFSITVTNVIEITKAETQDLDNDGFIDHYKITFDGNVDDSTFPGYNNGSFGSSQSQWTVAGYAGAVFDDTLGDPSDDNIIFIKFTEKTTPDTGVKPNLTTTASPGLKDTAGGSLGQILDNTIIEADRARPVLMKAEGVEGGNTLTVTFSETVYGSANAPACGAGGDIASDDLTYANTGAGGAGSITGMGSDTCGTDALLAVILTLNAPLASGDSLDSVTPAADSVYDAANNTAVGTKSPVISPNTAPTIISLTQTGANTLKIVYSENVDETTAKTGGNYVLVATKNPSGNCSDNSNFTGNTAVISISSITGSGTTYTITFSSDFASDTWYSLIADRANASGGFIKDVIGKELGCENYRSFYNDAVGPYIVSASGESCSGATEIWVETSEEVANLEASDSMDTSGNTKQIKYSNEQTSASCAVPLPSSTITSSKNSGSTREINVNINSVLCSGDFYKLRMRNPNDDGTYCGGNACIYMQDAVGNTPSKPYDYTFKINRQLMVQNAQAVDSSVTNYQYMVDVTFNKPVTQSRAECSNATDCNKIYYISGLGNITNAVLIGTRKVRLTTDTMQTGRFYTVVVNNGTTANNPAGWTAENTAAPVTSASTCTNGESLSGYPYDRNIFQGSGSPVNSLDDYFIDDPFQDGAKFVFAFNHNGQAYVGPNDWNNVSFRFEPNGANPSMTNFEFTTPTCATPNGFGHLLTGYNIYNTNQVYCGGANDNSGPDSEVGVVGFTKVTTTISSTNYDLILVGALKPNIGNLYYTQDVDNILTLKSAAITGANGTNTASIQTMAANKEFVFISIPSDHGTNSPVVNRYTATASGGSVTLGSIRDMSGNYISYIGKQGGAAVNPNKDRADGDVVGVDSMVFFNDALYAANNGGIVYLDSNANRGDTIGWDGSPSANDAKTIWTLVSPSTFNTTGNQTKWVSDKVDAAGTRDDAGGLGKTRPGEKGIPVLKVHNGKLYMVRNVSIAYDQTDGRSFADTANTRKAGSAGFRNGMESYYGEVWVCDPALGGDTGRSAQICESNDWTKIISGTESELHGSGSASAPDANAISMLEFVGNELYVGFDNPSSGLMVFHVDAASGISASNGSTLASAGWAKAGTSGLGSAVRNKYIFSSTTVTDSYGENYLFINVADDSVYSIRVYRQLGTYTAL